MILTHLAFFFFDGASSTVSVFTPTPGPERGINDAAINARRDYSFLTGDINGPVLSWDDIPLGVPTNSPTWLVIGAINAAASNRGRGINDAALNALRDYLTLTGDINGPSAQWDEVPLPPTTTVWNQP